MNAQRCCHGEDSKGAKHARNKRVKWVSVEKDAIDDLDEKGQYTQNDQVVQDS